MDYVSTLEKGISTEKKLISSIRLLTIASACSYASGELFSLVYARKISEDQ